MCRDSRFVVVLAVVTGAIGPLRASAQVAPAAGQPGAAPPAQAAPAPQPDPGRMRLLLRDWEQMSAKLSTLDVKLQRVDRSKAWGDESYEGRAILKSPNLAWLDFQKVAKDEKGKDKLVPHERIICTGGEVWQYRSDTKQIFIFPLDKQIQKRALEEGPLPFLFNMKAAEAEARYEMSLVNETPEYYVISVRPRLRIDQESFSKAFLKLNRKTFLPDRIFLVSPDGKSTKDFTLSAIRPNAAVAQENFVGKPLGAPWTIVRDPGNDAAARPAADRVPGVGNRAPAAAPPSTPPTRRR